MAISTELRLILSAQNQTTAAFAGLNKSLGDLAGLAVKVGAALASAFAFKETIAATTQFANEVERLRSVTGASYADAARLDFVFKTVGIDADEASIAIGRLDRNLFAVKENIHKTSVDAFEKWGIAIKDVHGNMRNVNDILPDIAQRVRELGPGAAATALEMDLFGRSGAKLNEMLMLGGERLHEYMRLSDELGLTAAGQATPAVKDFEHNLNILNMGFDALKIQLGQFILPILNNIVIAFTRFLAQLNAARGTTNMLSESLKVLANAVHFLLSAVKIVADRFREFIADIGKVGLVEALRIALQQLGAAGPVVQGLAFALTLVGAGLAGLVVEAAVGGVFRLAAGLAMLGARAALVLALGAALSVVYAAAEQVLNTSGRWTLLGDAITGLAIGIGALAGPVGLAVGAVVGALTQIALTVGLVRDNWDKFVFALRNDMLGDIPVFGAIFSAVKNLLTLIGAAISAYNSLMTAIGAKPISVPSGAGPTLGNIGVPGMAPSPGGGQTIYGPGTVPIGTFGGGGGGEFTAMQHGGIVRRPTLALLGEGGPEAVIPLRGGAPTVVNVYVSGNVAENEQRLADMVGDRFVQKLASFRALGY